MPHVEREISLDTDLGYDPDDFMALVYLWGQGLKPSLITTSFDQNGARLNLVRQFLAITGQSDIPAIEGINAPENEFRFIMDPKISDCRDLDLHKAYETLGSNPSRLLHLNLAPFTNIASVVTTVPGYSRARMLAMGSSWNMIFNKAEPNVRMDIDAARTIISTFPDIWLVLADHTVQPETAIGPDHPLVSLLKKSDHPVARLALENYTRWWGRRYPVSYLHDVLAVSSLVGDWVEFERVKVIFDDTGRMVEVNNGFEVMVSSQVDYNSFLDNMMASFERVLT